MDDTDYPMEITTLTPTVEQIDLTDSGPEDEGAQEQEVQNVDVDLTDAGTAVEEIPEKGVDLTDCGPDPEVVEHVELDVIDDGPEVVEIREPDAGNNEIDLTDLEPDTGKVRESEKVDLIDSGPEDENPLEPDAKRTKVDLIDAEPENGVSQEPDVEVIEVDLTESGPEDEPDGQKTKESAAKIRHPVTKKQMKKICGVKIDRFRFLLKQGYSLKQACSGSHLRTPFEAVATSVALAVAERRSQQDPWLFEKLKEGEKTAYFTMFMKSFHTLLEQGETVDDAWTLARRETDTRTVLETQTGRCDPKTFESKARIVICNTKHPEIGITSEEFRLILAEMRKNLAKITDIRYIPHLVECMLVPGTGYILVICCDELTIRWVRLTLKWMTLWPGASLCMVREKKFLESCFMTLSVPDIARPTGMITSFLKTQNHQVPLNTWSLLTAEPLDKEKVKKLTFLLPLKDRDLLKPRSFTLDYQKQQLKLTSPEDRTKIGKRALFRGIFKAAGMETAEIFQTIANENEGIDVTKEWKQLHRNSYSVTSRLCFYVDAASAEAIRAADNKISFKFEWVKLTYQARASEV